MGEGSGAGARRRRELECLRLVEGIEIARQPWLCTGEPASMVLRIKTPAKLRDGSDTPLLF